MWTKEKYYVISVENVGPNAEPLNEEYHIQTRPGYGNSSGKKIINGWLGTTDDIACYAHGEFYTKAEARQYIINNNPSFTRVESSIWYYNQKITDIYKDQRAVYTLKEWLEWDSIEITPDTTDEELQEMAKEFEPDYDKVYMDGSILDYLKELREENK